MRELEWGVYGTTVRVRFHVSARTVEEVEWRIAEHLRRLDPDAAWRVDELDLQAEDVIITDGEGWIHVWDASVVASSARQGTFEGRRPGEAKDEL